MARAKAKAKTTQMTKDMAEDRGAPRSVKKAIAPATRGLRFATRHNRLYEEATFLALVALAAAQAAPLGGAHTPTFGKCAGGSPRARLPARRVVGCRLACSLGGRANLARRRACAKTPHNAGQTYAREYMLAGMGTPCAGIRDFTGVGDRTTH